MSAQPQAANVHAVIMAGGQGTRFWPWSRRDRPKQFLPLASELPMLAQTVARLGPYIPNANIWIVAGRSHAQECRNAAPAIPKGHLLLEPAGRNTAAAVALAAVHVQRRHPNAVLCLLPADHHVADSEAFLAAIERAVAVAEAGYLVTLGVVPTEAATGFGYIERGVLLAPGGYGVRRFAEKPDRNTAERFLEEETYLWNAGVFVGAVRTFTEELMRHCPALCRAAHLVADAIDTPAYEDTLVSMYENIASISFDHAVMERTERAAVVPLDCGWCDVGSWTALGELLPADSAGNVSLGDTLAIESSGCIMASAPGGVVAALGVHDLIIVRTGDAVLVLPKNRAQDVRQIVEALSARSARDGSAFL